MPKSIIFIICALLIFTIFLQGCGREGMSEETYASNNKIVSNSEVSSASSEILSEDSKIAELVEKYKTEAVLVDCTNMQWLVITNTDYIVCDIFNNIKSFPKTSIENEEAIPSIFVYSFKIKGSDSGYSFMATNEVYFNKFIQAREQMR